MLAAAIITATATAVLAGVAVAQIRASGKQSADALLAATRQLQPIVLAHAFAGGGPFPGLTEEVEFRYYLSNEGLGPALNVEHGITLGEREYPFGGDPGMQFRTIRAGEYAPPLDDAGAVSGYIRVHVASSESDGTAAYWCRFENVFGERWETRNSTDPTRAPVFRRIDPSAR